MSRNKLFSFLLQHLIFLQVNNCFSFLFVYSIEYRFRILRSKIIFWKEYSENWAVYFAPYMLILSAVFLVFRELLMAQWFKCSIISPHKSNCLVPQKIIAGILQSETKTSTILYFCLHVILQHN